MLRITPATSASSVQLPPTSPPKLTLTLAAREVPARSLAIGSLAEGCVFVAAFIREHDLCAADYGDACGRIDRDGVPYCRVSFHGKLWALDEHGRETFREMTIDGEVRS